MQWFFVLEAVSSLRFSSHDFLSFPTLVGYSFYVLFKHLDVDLVLIGLPGSLY